MAETLKAANARRWANAKLTRNFSAIAKNLVTAKTRYQAVEAKTGVPWFVIAVIHMRESSQNWSRSLAQGDPWNKVSVHVPKGRGPFKSWEEAAIDALVNCAPHAARNKDWSVGGTLALLEGYNGLGYAAKGRPSPYLWAGTNQYTAGKYVADGKYDPNHVDTQPGCAGMILAMMAIDPTIKLGGEIKVTPLPTPTLVPKPETKPAVSAGTTATATAATVAVGGAGAAAAQAGLSAPEILGIITGVSLAAGAVIIIGYRIIKGIWPWTGNQSQELLLPSHLPSEKSLELASAQLALSSADLLAKPSPLPSAPSPRRKRSVKPSPRTRTPRKSSKGSKRSADKKSSPKRKSKSRN